MKRQHRPVISTSSPRIDLARVRGGEPPRTPAGPPKTPKPKLLGEIDMSSVRGGDPPTPIGGPVKPIHPPKPKILGGDV